MAEITVGILGIGRLGEALAKAVLARPGVCSLYVSRRNQARVEKLIEYDRRVQPADPQQMIADCDHLLIALRTDTARSLLPTLQFQARHQVISVMAEIGHTELLTLTQGAGSACRLLAMPAISGGKQTLPIYPFSPSAELLFGQTNNLLLTSSEQDLLSLWSITGLLSAAMMVGEVAVDWLIDSGIDPKQANSYARVIFSEVYAATEDGIASGIEHVSTPGGLNATAYLQLKQAGCDKYLRTSLEHIASRLFSGNKNHP